MREIIVCVRETKREMSGKVVEVMTGVVRPTANFSPSIWGDHFLKYASTNHSSSKENEKENQIYVELKESVREKLRHSNLIKMTLSDKLNLIDVIQRLGVSYHFNTEIEQVLQNMYIDDDLHYDNDDLHDCALCFRLLRQQGYNVSSLDNEGEFKTSIKNDIKGMLSLQEATHLRFRGEDVLEKAFNFTTKQFETILLHDRDLLDHINPHLTLQVTNSLNQSLFKGFVRIGVRNYFSFYENCNAHDKTLLEFAKLDFNVLQKIHQRELAELTRWWKDLDFSNKFSFSRDRLVESYFFASVIYFEPEYAYGRKTFTKVIVFLTVLDDIYDAYGIWEELLLLTDTINRYIEFICDIGRKIKYNYQARLSFFRWERNGVNQLSEHIRYFNDALHDYFEVLEKEGNERKMLHGVEYFKQMVKVMANAYMNEAKWLHEKYIPTLEEYMNLALVSAATRFCSIALFIGMDPIFATKEAFHWAFEDPPIMKAVAVIQRLVDDIVGFKFEREREHIASSIQCYINQHGVSEELAIFELEKRVIDAWKDINFELIEPTKVPKILLDRVVGLAVFMVLYREKDGYTHPESKQKDVINLFVNHVEV